MKSKIVLFGLVMSLLFSLGSCKSKESAYKAAYEAAKEKETTAPVEVTPVEKATTGSATTTTVQKEKVTAIDGELLQFSVVVGSFTSKTNAVNLKERMGREGYKSVLAQNENGMYRVIVFTSGEKNSAAKERDLIKAKYINANPNFQDAWILDKQ